MRWICRVKAILVKSASNRPSRLQSTDSDQVQHYVECDNDTKSKDQSQRQDLVTSIIIIDTAEFFPWRYGIFNANRGYVHHIHSRRVH